MDLTTGILILVGAAVFAIAFVIVATLINKHRLKKEPTKNKIEKGKGNMKKFAIINIFISIALGILYTLLKSGLLGQINYHAIPNIFKSENYYMHMIVSSLFFYIIFITIAYIIRKPKDD